LYFSCRIVLCQYPSRIASSPAVATPIAQPRRPLVICNWPPTRTLTYVAFGDVTRCLHGAVDADHFRTTRRPAGSTDPVSAPGANQGNHAGNSADVKQRV
jgi:hypothetical protein